MSHDLKRINVSFREGDVLLKERELSIFNAFGIQLTDNEGNPLFNNLVDAVEKLNQVVEEECSSVLRLV